MHWNGGHFEAPVTIDQTLFITEHKHYAIRGTADKTTFGDASVNTEILGKSINVISGTSFDINAKNGTGSLNSTGDLGLASSAGKVNINGKTGITGSTDGSLSMTSVGNASVKSSNGTLDLGSKTKSTLGSDGSVEVKSGTTQTFNAGTSFDINAKNGTGSLNSTGDLGLASSAGKVNINGKTGITVGSVTYGTKLPDSGSEGQIFFKLIS